ncbi:dihydrolipoamide acetyltransferase component of pyruvate dehydrogenase complex [Nonlabens ulvanivorans]|nr:pyruvate dehydrogenase complex dihydrolipoamide acetyltransferase [Nonlabens ulvanivorans]GAK88769.1 dihydrolipoamide acetyltransferase component of pyruvate dehydrogenase complex [Nonlabens ulvanivorans]
MAEIVNMPRLSDTMEEGVVAAWLKNVGDKIEEGDILAEIETDKATMEFESFQSGVLLHIGVQEGETAPVDQLLCIIGEEGEDISGLLNGDTSDASKDEAPTNEESKESKDSSSVESTSGNELPEGVIIINMPRLSDTMEEGTVASWLKAEGDAVEEGDILAEIETDKATMEFESFNAGTLLKIGIQEGETAKVDALLAIIGPAGTDISGIDMEASANASASKKEEKKEIKKEEKKEAPKASTPAASTSSTNSNSSSNSSVRIFASPLAKKMAEDKGIDLNQVSGSGENGRIVKSDIENYKPSAGGSAAASSFIAVGTETFEEVPNSQMRKTIAKRLGESKFTAPHYYLGLDLDMDNAIASRKAINELPDTKISFNDMVIKAAAMALRLHPKVNTQWTDKNTVIAKHIHVGVAVAVDDGLLVPVLPFADQMSMQQIGSKVRELAGKARNKKLQPDEMQGSTFTISNLGMFGITEFTSIINQPNSAIMSVGAIVQKPVVKNGQIVVGNVMKITLACDHRTVDGATGAAFLQTFKSYIENPIVMYV